MSSWNPSEETERGSRYSPGVQEREIHDQREFSEVVYDFDRMDYVFLGVLASVPASILTMLLVLAFYPEYQHTAGEIVRILLEFLPFLGGLLGVGPFG